MARGRPPKPTERLAATRRNPTHKANGTEIAVREVTPDRSVPPLPATIPEGTRGEVEWQRIWTAGFWLHRDKDYYWVETIARACADIEEFRAEIPKLGLTVTGYAGQITANPLLKSIHEREQTILKCLQVLGFSPTDRARLAITEAKAKSAVQDFLDRAKP